MKEKRKENKRAHPLYTSILLLLMAVAAITAATMAWLSIADSTRVRSMSMDVTSGVSLRFDLDAHADFQSYVQTLTFQQISARIQRDQGYVVQDTPLEPVTTSDFSAFTYENGTVVAADTGVYLEYALNFMGTRDMVVHLTSSAGSKGEAGTSVTSSNSALPDAMRIAFTTDGNTVIYDPGMAAGNSTINGNKIFGLPAGANMTYTDGNALFSLKEGINKPVVVHIWLEGTDAACTDDLKGADYAISLRFEGTDTNNQTFNDATE